MLPQANSEDGPSRSSALNSKKSLSHNSVAHLIHLPQRNASLRLGLREPRRAIPRERDYGGLLGKTLTRPEIRRFKLKKFTVFSLPGSWGLPVSFNGNEVSRRKMAHAQRGARGE
jgi:hypothetical protein